MQGCIAVVSMAFGSGFLSCLVRIVVAVSCGGMCSKKRGRLVRRADKTMYMDKQEKKACKNGRAENRLFKQIQYDKQEYFSESTLFY